ncbi:unnamed protein product [Prunus brigantina]
MCTLELHHGGRFENGVYKMENCDGDLTQNGVDYIEVEAEETFENVGTKVASEDVVKEVAGAELPNEDVVKEVPNEDAGAKLPNEDIGAHFSIDTEGAELPNEDIGAYVTIDNEGAELPNEDEDADSEIEDSDYEFSDNEAEDRPTIGENVADEGTSHGAPGEVSSDGADTSEFDTGSETDSEGNGRKKIKLPKFKQYRRDVDLKNPEFRLGMKFANKKLLIEAIKELAIIEAREVKLIKNDNRRVQAKCVKGCSFQVYGSRINREEGTFAIKTLSLEHQCGRVDKLRHTTSKWLCDRYAHKLRRNSDFDLKSFQQDVLADYKINVTKLQVYRAKRLARDLNEGPYPRQILTAVGVDGNNGYFPVAYAVVDIESKDSWIWFFNLLIEDLGITNGQAWVVISDKQKGLVPAIERVLPTAEHRMCVRHLYSNFRASHNGLALKHILWAAARATTVPWWEAEMENMKNEDEEAWKWLKKRPARNWSRSHFGSHFKCDLLLNNLCESFNAAILDARDKTILSCLERIRVYVMLRMASRRSACQNWRYSVGPRIFKIIEKNKLGSSQCIPRLAGEKLYQVSHIYAIFQRCENPIAYVDACYKLETYMKAYEPVIHPIPSMDQWSKCGLPPIKPPLYKQQPGRPKRVRTKEPGEVEIPAPIPPNPMPPNYIAPPAKLRRVHASSTQMEQGSSSNTVRGRGIRRGRCISRGRGNVGQATADPNSLQSVTGRNGQGVLPSSHIGLGRGLPSSKLSAIRGRGLGRGMGAGRCLGRGLPSSRSTVARGRGQGGPALDNISYDNNMASI